MTAQEFFKNDLFAENAGVVLLEENAPEQKRHR